MKLKSSPNKNFYESNLNKNNLLKVSNLFSLCDDIQECYNVLIDNLNKYKDDIKIDSIDKNSLKLLFSLELPTKKKIYTNIILYKKIQELKNNEINEKLDELCNKFDSIQEHQNKLEKKFEEKFEGINSIIDKQNKLEKELKNKNKEIEEIRTSQSKLENIFKNNENKIEQIDKKQKDILFEIEMIKNDEKKLDDNNMEKKRTKEVVESFPDINKKIELLKQNQKEIKNIFINLN